MAKSPSASAPQIHVGIIGRLKLFVRAIGRSCFDMEFYRQVRVQPWTGGLAYFLKLMAIVTLAVTAIIGPGIYRSLDQARRYVIDKIPDSASVTLSGGQLSAALPMPLETGSGKEKIILDTAVTGLDMPRERLGDDGLLIGRDAIFMRSGGTEERVYALKDMPTFSVNKRMVLDWINKFILPVSVGLTLMAAVSVFLVDVIGYLVFILMGAALALVMARFWKVSLKYIQWVAVGLYAVTLPLILASVFDFIGWKQVPVFPVVFFMILASVVADERAASTAAPSDKPPAGESGRSKEGESMLPPAPPPQEPPKT